MSDLERETHRLAVGMMGFSLKSDIRSISPLYPPTRYDTSCPVPRTSHATKHRLCVSVGRRLAGPLHFGRFGPPEKIIGEAGKSLVEHQSGLSNRFSFRRQ
jgi:hypothetical protein